MSDLPAGWEERELDELNDPQRPVCYGILKPGPDLPGGVPYVKVRNIRDERIHLDQLHHTSAEIDGKYARSRLRTGDLLVSIRGTYGRVALVPEQLNGGNITQDSARIAPIGVDTAYVQKYLQSPSADLFFRTVARGVAVKGVNIRDLRKLPVPVPPLPEQKRIVAAIEEAFSKLDAGEAGLRTVRQRLQRMRESVLTAAVSGDWESRTLGDVAEVVGGVTKDSKRQGDPAYVEVPYLRVANVQRGYLDLEKVTTIRVAPNKAKALALEPGDVLFNEGGDRDKLGRGWVWDGQIPGCIHQNHVFRARLDGRLQPKLLSWWGNTFGRSWFEERGKQTTNLASLNLKTLKSFPVPLPPLDEQERIVAEVELQMSFIEAGERAVDVGLTKAAALRRSVLKVAFEGKLVPQDPNDEPASELLERIRAERAVAEG